MEEKGRGKPGTKFRDIYIYIYTYVLLLLVWYGCCEKRVQDSNGCVCQVALFFW